MNKGIAKSTGNWICFMNSEDSFVNKDTLQKIIESYSLSEKDADL